MTINDSFYIQMKVGRWVKPDPDPGYVLSVDSMPDESTISKGAKIHDSSPLNYLNVLHYAVAMPSVFVRWLCISWERR